MNNTCFQVTAEPAQFGVCTHKNNLTTEFIDKSNVFSISIIQQDVDLNYIGHWGFKSGRDFNKFEGIDYRIGKTGAPIVLDKTTAFLECEVVQKMDVGSHMIFIGKVVDSDILNKDSIPLTYSHYRNVIKGLSPKNAPTYIAKKKVRVETIVSSNNSKDMDEFICSVCGFVYNPEEGDKTSGILPGTPFDELPDEWVCPICGVGKEKFNRA
ncbi:flavin reductase [Bacteroidota bacterium]